MSELGPIYTKGSTYRARAEARQREYRARVLDVTHGEHGHFLAKTPAADGRNFVVREAFDAARARQRAGKGVDPSRTFANMLSSQAMCFNVFAPLSTRVELASSVLTGLVPGLARVKAIHIEHTPAADIFNDQSGRGGVDCDLLIEGETATRDGVVLVIETKFVEPEFSICGFRKPGREKKGQDVCPEHVSVRGDRRSCLYSRNKSYRYWERADEHGVLAADALPEAGCPFAGSWWQLWVNLTLAHVEAARRGAKHVGFAVCASSQNTALLGTGEVLGGFRSLLRRPDSVHLIDLEQLIDRIQSAAPPDLRGWADGLRARYQGI